MNCGWEIPTENATVGVQPQMVVKDQGYHPPKCSISMSIFIYIIYNSGLVIIGNFAQNYFVCKHEEAIQEVVVFRSFAIV